MKKFFYHGESMRREFLRGDVIRAEEIAFDAVRPGDVIVFHLPGDDEATIHRAIRRTPVGWITLGDNNPAPDKRPVTPEIPLLIAVAVERGRRVVAIRRGFAGRLTATCHRLRRAIRKATVWLLAEPLVFVWPKRDAKRLDVTRFGTETVFTEPRNGPVRARIFADGVLRMADFRARLFYRKKDMEKRVEK